MNQDELKGYVKENLVKETIVAPDHDTLKNDIKAIADEQGLPTEASQVEAVPTELPSAGIEPELPPAPVIANDAFIEWMRKEHPKTRFYNTANHHINDIMAALPAVTSQWKVQQIGMWRKMAQKLFQATFMPYLMNPETIPFLSSKGTYLGYVLLQNAALTFNIHVVVPQGTPDAILPPYPLEGFSAATFLLMGIPELGPKAINIGLMKKPDASLRILPSPLISMTQTLTEGNIFNLSKGALRYIGTPPKGRPLSRKSRVDSAAAVGLALAMGASSIPPGALV
ncbi:MAG TPA: hypothetical protein VN081_04980 [Dongiaceae bacterium]|nr:hypothetical protein [Dongiaceae bacterium]